MNLTLDSLQFYAIQLLIISILFFSNCTIKEEKEQIINSDSAELISPKIAAFLKDFESSFIADLTKSQAPGAIVSVVLDTSQFSKGYGFANKNTRQKNNEYTLFKLGSLSKGFAATVANIVASKGQLDFNEPVQQIVPEFHVLDSLQSMRIKVKHLLSHSSGLPRHAYTNLVEDGVPLKNIIPEFKKLEVIAPEDSLYAYQNAAFGMIESILKKKTGTNYSQLLEEDIISKSQMNCTSTDYSLFNSEFNKASPHLFVNSENGFVPSQLNDKYKNLTSAGGVHSCAKDLCTWMSILIGNHPDIISQTALDNMFEPIVPTRSRKYYDRWSESPAHYAMGWRVIEIEQATIFHHTGFVNNYRSEIAIDRKNKWGICVIYNAFIAEAKDVVPLFRSKYEKHFGQKVDSISLAK